MLFSVTRHAEYERFIHSPAWRNKAECRLEIDGHICQVCGKVLIIAPLRVARFSWGAEIRKWEHLKNLRYSIVVGTEKERRAALQQKADIYIINRENLPWLIENTYFDYDMVVVDELSSFKNHQAKRFKALMKVRPQVKRIECFTMNSETNRTKSAHLISISPLISEGL